MISVQTCSAGVVFCHLYAQPGAEGSMVQQ